MKGTKGEGKIAPPAPGIHGPLCWVSKEGDCPICSSTRRVRKGFLIGRNDSSDSRRRELLRHQVNNGRFHQSAGDQLGLSGPENPYATNGEGVRLLFLLVVVVVVLRRSSPEP